MYISTIAIQGYKIFKNEFKITLNPGLNIILGENASGKSAIIDAIRLILQEDEYGRTGINPSDFHRPLSNPAKHRGADKMMKTTMATYIILSTGSSDSLRSQFFSQSSEMNSNRPD